MAIRKGSCKIMNLQVAELKQTFNLLVAGSNPAGPTKYHKARQETVGPFAFLGVMPGLGHGELVSARMLLRSHCAWSAASLNTLRIGGGEGENFAVDGLLLRPSQNFFKFGSV